MGNHALLSPSSSHRWLQCTPSAVLETEFENKSSNAAEEGTAAHALCEHKLKKALRRRSKRPVSPFNTDEMEEHNPGRRCEIPPSAINENCEIRGKTI